MAQVGSNVGVLQQSLTGVTDAAGNPVVSADNTFGASPLGIAARTQALYGIPNANFNLTPPDPNSPIVENENDLPYWSISDQSDAVMSATSVFDETTLTYGVLLDPGTAAVNSSMTLTTRSYLLTDDNLALRQKALAVLEKSGTAAGTTQWNLTLSATYYDAAGSALSTAFIGTALDTGTWTSFSGTTTPGGSAINAAAQYVDLAFTMTATAAVTGSAKATVKSLLLATSTPGGGGAQSFQVSEVFSASDTWTRPTGVEYLTVLCVGGGGGGGGGGFRVSNNTVGTSFAVGGGGGGGGAFTYVSNLYIGDQTSVSIGVGAAGTGGAGTSFTKAAGVSAPLTAVNGGSGGAGGASSFGTYIVANGGGAGVGGTAVGTAGSSVLAAVGAGGTVTVGV